MRETIIKFEKGPSGKNIMKTVILVFVGNKIKKYVDHYKNDWDWAKACGDIEN